MFGITRFWLFIVAAAVPPNVTSVPGAAYAAGRSVARGRGAGIGSAFGILSALGTASTFRIAPGAYTLARGRRA